MVSRQVAKRRGFTLLELLVVVAILAILAGGLIVAYDGLEEKSSKGVATFNLGALDQAIRTFTVLNQGFSPNGWDSLCHSASGTGTDATALNILPAVLKGKLGPRTLTAQDVTALTAAGITSSRYVTGAYTNSVEVDGLIPQRVFDNPTRGYGVPVTLAAGTIVAAVEGLGQADFTGATPADSARLRDIGNLDQTLRHVVVAFGIGNNSTLIKGASGNSFSGGLSEAPLYTNVQKQECNRFVALYILASDSDASGTIDAGEYRSKAHLLAIIDTKGDWYDEEYAEYTGQH